MISLINANSLHMPLADGSVHMIATSPPYFGLRDYGTATWEGGDAECSHTVGNQVADNKAAGAIVAGGRPGVDASVCRKCGAIRIDNQLGLEPLHDCLAWARSEPPCGACYVCQMRAVAAECWRVLRDDGVMWLNLGDSYANNNSARDKTFGNPEFNANRSSRAATKTAAKSIPPNLKPKDIIGTPWRVAFALQADGWYLRQDIIWAKPNPMPESVTARCTKAHEYVFLLAKSARYYYDNEAVKEDSADPSGSAARYASAFGGAKNEFLLASDQVHTRPIGMRTFDGTRNRRSVWTVATQPYSGAHFATWPPALVEPMIKAGCPVAGIVLDPFAGSGTTGVVARQLGRRFVGLDLSFAYLRDNARPRLELDKLAAWNGNGATQADHNYADLPLLEAMI